MTISDLKAMYDYYLELRKFYSDRLILADASSPEFEYNKENLMKTANKFYNVGKQLDAAIEEAYEKEIQK